MKKAIAVIAILFSSVAFSQQPTQAEPTVAQLKLQVAQLKLQIIQLQSQLLQYQYNDTQRELQAAQQENTPATKTDKTDIKPAFKSAVGSTPISKEKK